MEKQRNIVPELSKYRGIIFDLDGTLVELGVDWKKLKEELAKYCYLKKNINIEFVPLDQKLLIVRDLFGEQFYTELLDIVSGFEMREENYKFNQILIDYINSNSGKHRKFAIYSMNTKKCINNIIKKYFQERPDIIISKDNCSELKPTQKDILRIIEKWGFKKREIMFLGNSENDLISGKMAGVTTFMVKI